MNPTEEVKKYMSQIGRKGGKTKGKAKRRGDSEYYRNLSKRRKKKLDTKDPE